MEKLPSPKHLSGFYFSFKTKWLTFWRSLTFAQRLYFTAIVLFFLLLNGESEATSGISENEQFLNEPIDTNNHAIDACRYIAMFKLSNKRKNMGSYTISIR